MGKRIQRLLGARREGCPMQLRYLDFFAGAGLVRLALDDDWQCVWANDIDERKAEVYGANFGLEDYLVADVATVDAKSLPERVDMAWASFPCQDLSLAGWRRGMAAERSGTFWAFWRIMRDLYDMGDRPPLIVLENVTGLLYGDGFIGLSEALAALGMRFGAMVIDAKEFLPQSRPRVFIVAVDSRLDYTPFVDDDPESSPWFTKAVRSAHAALPPSLADLWTWWKLPRPDSKIPSLDSMIDDEPEGVDWHDPEETKKLLNMMTDINLAKVEKAREKDGRSVGMLYKRTRQGQQRAEVRFDGISGCLRTPNGGSSRQIVMITKKDQVRSRLLSPREAARLMGVPDSFWLPDHYNNAYRAMGDGVAVPVVSWLSKHLLIPLAEACAASAVDLRGKNGTSDDDVQSFRQGAEDLANQWESSLKVAAN